MNGIWHREARSVQLRRFAWAVAGVWTVAIGTTLTWELVDEYHQARLVARAEAQGICHKELGLLEWYGVHGGVYVRDGAPRPATPPAEAAYRLVPHPDMVREIRGLAHGESPILTHLAGPRATRPENAFDPWEQAAWEALARGEPQVSAESGIRNQAFVRVMRPVRAGPKCLACHERQGFREDERMGAISVSVPVASVWPRQWAESLRRLVAYGGMWFLGLCAVLLGTRHLERQMQERRLAEWASRERDTQMLASQQIQKHLLPRAAPATPGFDIAGASFSAELTSGDYFDYLPIAPGGLGLVVADVCGRGIGPAMLMASLHALLRPLAYSDRSISQTLASANRFLFDFTPHDRFVTLLLGRLDPVARTFTYASAGHPSGYVLDASGEVKARLESTDLPLGVTASGEFPVGPSVSLAPGDLLLLLTDGIMEARSPDEGTFGIGRTLEVVHQNRTATAAAILAALFRAASEFSRRDKPQDDMTAIVVKVLAATTAG